MILKDLLSKISSLRFLIEDLNINSSMGKLFMLNSKMMYSSLEINFELNNISKLISFINDEKQKNIISNIKTNISHLREIKTSISNLKSGLILDDIELFEIKAFAMLSQEVFHNQENLDTNIVELFPLRELISILDPQNTNIPSFYIYDNYCVELANARKKLKIAKQDKLSETELEKLYFITQEEELKVRTSLCEQLLPFTQMLSNNLRDLAYLDCLIAKAEQSIKYNLCRPSIGNGINYKSMFNPQLKEGLGKQDKKYQAIDISLEKSVCFITGANMAGKTVILKTLALCQYLFQLGFYVPAQKASIAIVNNVYISIGDEQSEITGLSSFASEILGIDNMLKQTRKDNNALVLVDELARTTNPIEGLAIVNAVADILQQNNVCSVITTHYSGLDKQFRKLRVRGLDKYIEIGAINAKNINNYIDYSLTEDKDGEIPHEALRIASILGVDDLLIQNAKDKIKIY